MLRTFGFHLLTTENREGTCVNKIIRNLEFGHVTGQPFLGVLLGYLVTHSSPCYFLESRALINEIYGYPIIKWIATAWPTDRAPRNVFSATDFKRKPLDSDPAWMACRDTCRDRYLAVARGPSGKRPINGRHVGIPHQTYNVTYASYCLM